MELTIDCGDDMALLRRAASWTQKKLEEEVFVGVKFKAGEGYQVDLAQLIDINSRAADLFRRGGAGAGPKVKGAGGVFVPTSPKKTKKSAAAVVESSLKIASSVPIDKYSLAHRKNNLEDMKKRIKLEAAIAKDVDVSDLANRDP